MSRKHKPKHKSKNERDGDKERPVDQALFDELKTHLAAAGRLRLQVVTGSMSPVIAVGATIQIEPLKDDPARFDIIVFRAGDRLVCHQFIGHARSLDPNKRLFYTAPLKRGEDLPISEGDVLGIVTNYRVPFRYRLKRYFRSLLRRLRRR